jgi:hypothetical protein
MTEPATPSAEIVPSRGLPGVAHAPEIKARCFVLYSTEAGRNCAAVERLIAEELDGTREGVPSRQTIAGWARDEQWSSQADNLWRSTRRWGVRELQVIAIANAVLGQRRRHEVLLGKYRGDHATAAQYLKAGELSDRFIERVLPLSSMEAPPRHEADTEDVPREVAEARALAAMIQRKKDR